MPPGSALRVAAVLALCCVAARAEVANRIVATIDGEPITAHELREWVRERGGETLPDADALDGLITQRLLEKEIKTAGINARDEDIDRYIAEVQQRSGLDADGFERALVERGLTKEAYRARVKNEIERAQLVNKEIRQRVNVTPAEVKRYYEAHLEDYATAEKVTVRGIFIAIDEEGNPDAAAQARAEAEAVRDKARNGTSFDKLVREHSDGPNRDKGGELGTFSRGEMDARLDEVAFALKPKQVSDPIETPAGFHLLYVEERVSGAHKPLDEVSAQIRETLYNEALEERFQTWLSRDLRERHHVEVLP